MRKDRKYCATTAGVRAPSMLQGGCKTSGVEEKAWTRLMSGWPRGRGIENSLKFKHEALQRHLVFIFNHNDDTFHIPLPRSQLYLVET